MTNLFDALEFCLREIEEGGDLETAVTRFPEFKDELLPILETSVKARAMAAPEPSQDAVRRSRSRVMQRAAELREMRIVVPQRRAIPLFQRLAISFTLAAVFLLSGNGLLSASASALPGEQLYPVKRGWESVRLFFIFDAEARELLANEFENERLHEASELLVEGRHEVIEFAGVFMLVNGQTYISGLSVILPADMQLPENGDAVIVSGRTNAQGYVELITLELLPDGSVVPAGNPVEIEVESHQTDNNAPSASTSDPNQSGAATATKTVEYEVKGTIESISETGIVLNGMDVYLQNANIIGKLCVGSKIEVIGYYDPEGRFIALEIEGASSCPSILGTGNSSNDSNTLPSTVIQGSNSENSNDEESSTNDNNNSDDDDNDDDDGDNSGKGGGGDDD
ncbi:MAG: hypothetical protein H6635_06930 [Anaerolineales bacterium]|nr:hypothetical protein [Anaerolineales bacterium]MCB9145086.1 hypothetical protein [Anaerolineales bacterium]